jgi:probable F420-dependent oxidoreductase
MRVDEMLRGTFDEVEARALELEASGYGGATMAETSHDPFLLLLAAARATTTLELSTEVAIAFARTPMTMAASANDLHQAAKGRFTLGLGSQIKPHIERRFSMPWSHPAARMREFVLAMRAIWEAWNTGGKLDFRGEFYTHTLMTPFFAPGPNPYGTPKVMVAGVGERMTEVAGEVGDGMIVHPFTTPKYVDEVTLPALARGFASGGKTRAEFEITMPVCVVTGTTDAEWDAARTATKSQIAFYGSTPGYHGVLRTHGWDDLGPELNQLSRQGEWAAMGELITDDILETFAVIAPPDELAAGIMARWGGLLDRLSFYAVYESDPELWAQVVADLK